MSNTLKLLHPFMPFITEEIWQSLPHQGESIMVSKWPEYDPSLSFAKDRHEMQSVMNAIRAVRNRRAEMNVPPSRKAHLSVAVAGAAAETFRQNTDVISRLAYASQVEIADSWNLPDAVTIVTDAATLYIPTDELVDKQAELSRLQKELESTQKQLDSAQAKLKNETFLSKAPDNVVDGVRKNAEKLAEKAAGIRQALEALAK
jgi:valyl-tRNA synthetase